ncbi:type VI secretion system baseplate subunit TssK [Brucella oryzae]|uniref:Type VI secretion system baseplate subunit TssK n=2 Tax=Brucella oryzae TaxID=335286 RepID=A0A2S7J0W5_9HYPH|nr:type VI secretion system baseplate subunit TssK [Brucella oryzae]PQA73893.1 type VI secretion system baseplate subunit TssK [Brucella oryzae]
MHRENRVIWGEGMFLRPQHFQQADRWTERMTHLLLHMMPGYFRGIAKLEIDTGALTRGELALLALRVVMPDGSMIEAPIDAALPAPLQLKETSAGYSVYLALPRREAQEPGIARSDAPGLQTGKFCRIRTQEIDVADANGDISPTAPVEIGQFNLQLVSERTDAADTRLTGLAVLEIARVLEVKPDKSVQLDENFIPCCLNCAASPNLISAMKELIGLIERRAEVLAQRIGSPAQLSLSETADFLLLSALNRTEPRLKHMLDHAATTPPAEFFELCLALTGDIAALTRVEKRPVPLPVYDHDDLNRCFPALLRILRNDLASMIEKRVISINLVKKQFGLYIGKLGNPALLENATCILAVRSSLPEEDIRSRLPSQIKIGPIEEIVKLVKLAIFGIGLRILTVVPRQLPYQPSTVYFELDRNALIWGDLLHSKAIALHLAAPFPDIEMQIWVLKQ